MDDFDNVTDKEFLKFLPEINFCNQSFRLKYIKANFVNYKEYLTQSEGSSHDNEN